MFFSLSLSPFRWFAFQRCLFFFGRGRRLSSNRLQPPKPCAWPRGGGAGGDRARCPGAAPAVHGRRLRPGGHLGRGANLGPLAGWTEQLSGPTPQLCGTVHFWIVGIIQASALPVLFESKSISLPKIGKSLKTNVFCSASLCSIYREKAQVVSRVKRN